ncbi:hypothetical protein [Endozoicomonas sp.]|uniref:hypothetical protein n=1 Tax=Endozoicomonas sp. TaxID=1892382 RepID=UPI003D9B6D6C
MKALWQGTPLEAFFENRYAPTDKAKALMELNFNPRMLRDVSHRIIDRYDVIPRLMDIIWLTHQPDHPLWQLDSDTQELLTNYAGTKLLSEIQAIPDRAKREIIAGKIMLHYINTANPGLTSYELGTLFLLIEDPVISAYLRSLMERL